MRFPMMGVYTDGAGNIVVGGTLVIYEHLPGDENNPTTVATIYEAVSGGSPVTSLTTDQNGVYEAWVDTVDYGAAQVFTLILSKSTHTEVPFHEGVIGLASGSENLVINGDMPLAQRGTSFATLTASQYTLDRMEWIDTGTTAGVVTITQDTDVPTVAEAGTKFMNSLKIDVTTAETLGSGDAALYLSHKIEAQDVTFFGHGATGALSGTLSFWFKSTKTGIFTVNVDRDDATEKYSTEFTVGTTNTWEKHTVTIPGDTDGTAITDNNGIGLALQFMMAVGTTGRTSTADAWNASGVTELATSNQVNLLDNTSNNVLITGILYQLGSIASDFPHRSIATELAMAQRYYTFLDDVRFDISRQGSSTHLVHIGFPTNMRTAPSNVRTNFIDTDSSGLTITSLVLKVSHINAFGLSAGATAGDRYQVDIALDAEL